MPIIWLKHPEYENSLTNHGEYLNATTRKFNLLKWTCLKQSHLYYCSHLYFYMDDKLLVDQKFFYSSQALLVM